MCQGPVEFCQDTVSLILTTPGTCTSLLVPLCAGIVPHDAVRGALVAILCILIGSNVIDSGHFICAGDIMYVVMLVICC